MPTDATAVAREFYATLEKAWNDADGAAFAAPFTDDASFVDIRGVIHDGGPAELSAGHQAIFDSIYKGSVVRIKLDGARAVGDDVILARSRSTLDVPAGPLAGVILAVNSIVLVRADDEEWRAASFHNTPVTG
jgi:uncharacterized protein (TIGR02246 family)